MEQWSLSHKNLQNFCASFWDTAEDCQIILGEIGVTSIRIKMNEPSLARWFSIITELMRMNDGSMNRLVTVLISKYPHNDALRTVCSPWISVPMRDGINASAPVPVPTPVPTPVPVQSKAHVTVATTIDIPEGAALVQKYEPDAATPTPNGITPRTDIKLVPLVVSEEFSDDAALVIPRVQTLWDLMAEINERLILLEEWRSAMLAAANTGKKK